MRLRAFGDLLFCRADQHQCLHFSVETPDPLIIGRILVIPPADQHCRTSHRLDRLDRSVGVGAFGIIVVGNTVYLAHIFDPVLHAREGSQHFLNLVQRHAHCQSAQYSGTDIFIIMLSEDPKFIDMNHIDGCRSV